jgi:hypothetical protein
VPNRDWVDWLFDPLNREKSRVLAARKAEAAAKAEDVPQKSDAVSLAQRIERAVKFLREFKRRGGWILSDGKSSVKVHTEEDTAEWLKRTGR